MAKLRTNIIAIALFCLFIVSLAGTQPKNDEATAQVSFPPSEAAIPAARLPSEPFNTETDSNSAVVSSVPLTEITFRPVNRRFHVRPKHPFRHRYSNDMLVSSGENSHFQEPVLHREGRRIPGRWMKMHQRRRRHHDHSDSDNEDRAKKIVFKKYDYDGFDGEKKLKKLRKRFRNEKEQKKKGVFMECVSKFLDHFH